MGKCCSVDRNELADENIQIIRMKIPRPLPYDLKQPNLDDLNTINNGKNINSELNNSPLKYQKCSSSNEVKTNKDYHKKIDEEEDFGQNNIENIENNKNEGDKKNYSYYENLQNVPDEDIRMHVFS